MLSKKPPRWLQSRIRRLQQKYASQTQKAGSKTSQQQTGDKSAKTAVAQNDPSKDTDDNQGRLNGAQECQQEIFPDPEDLCEDLEACTQGKSETMEMSEQSPEIVSDTTLHNAESDDSLCAQPQIEQIAHVRTNELEDFDNRMKTKREEFNSQLLADPSGHHNQLESGPVQLCYPSVEPMPGQSSPIDEDNHDQQYCPTFQCSPAEEFSRTDEATCNTVEQYSLTDEGNQIQQYSPTDEGNQIQQYSPTDEDNHIQQYSPTFQATSMDPYKYSHEDDPICVENCSPSNQDNLAEQRSRADQTEPASLFKEARQSEQYNPIVEQPVDQVGIELLEVNHQLNTQSAAQPEGTQPLEVSNDSGNFEGTQDEAGNEDIRPAPNGTTELQPLTDFVEKVGKFYRGFVQLLQQQPQPQQRKKQHQEQQLQLQQQQSLQHQKEVPLQLSNCTAQLGVILPTASKDAKAMLRPPTDSVQSKRSPDPILRLPYPVETCGADLQRAFPGQIGRFYVTDAYSYAYSFNRMSIEMAAESMGFDKRNFINPSTTEPNIQQSGLEDLENDLESDPRLTLMFLKPRRMKWTNLKNCLVFERCHPSRHFIADKWQMFCVLRNSASLKHLQMSTASGRKFDYKHFILYTANPGNYQKDLMQYLDAHPGTYILKRTDFSMGIGIQIYQAEKPNTVEKLQRHINPRAGLRQYVLQKYIERPLLVDKRKFDLRVYMLLISCKRPAANTASGFENSYFAFCYPGYVKLSCYPYNQSSRDLHVHLTNQYVQKRRPSFYSQVKEATTWFPDELNQYLNKRGRTEADWCQNVLYGQIRTIVGYLAAAFRPHLDSNASPASVYRLYGPDFIIDEELRVWLLEVNTFPAYSKNTIALSGSIRNMWREAVTLATETTLRYKNHQPVEGLTTMRNFRMAYSSEDPMLLNDLVRQNFA